MSSQPPNWASGQREIAVLPDRPTWFEEIVAKLKLEESEWSTHPMVVNWVKRHKESRYVPESLLRELGLQVKGNWSNEGW